jgi:cytochrome c2
MTKPRLAWAAMAAVMVVVVGAPASEAASSTNGQAVFARQCSLCHTIGKGEPNRFGPNLFGIADRKAGRAPGYRYSPAFMALANWTWSPDGIASFVAAPGKTIPGNRMAVFQGVADKDLDDLIAYLARQK